MIAVIGGGLTGLICATRLAQQGHAVQLFESAPHLGGRTRSFYESKMQQWVDNGPHLLSGAYQHTQQWLAQARAMEYVYWQPALNMTMWDASRRLFHFRPKPQLPLPLAMACAVTGMPGHGLESALGLVKMRLGMGGDIDDRLTALNWLLTCGLPETLRRDLFEPLCLGIMNEPLQTANAKSFACALQESFASHQTARLGWFTKPLSEALIGPLEQLARRSGVCISTRHRIRQLQGTSTGVDIQMDASTFRHYQAAVLTMPAHTAARLLNIRCRIETRPITNIHLWFEQDIGLPDYFVGGIGTTGQWFFDISRQMHSTEAARHICAVISADEALPRQRPLIETVCSELRGITNHPGSLSLKHARIVRERHATVLVQPGSAIATVSGHVINACECPQPGDIPATIEAAIRRGEEAASCVPQVLT
ncbi:MAG: FAD-dependent oxidoreductase [Mariprofundaceae bacterium]